MKLPSISFHKKPLTAGVSPNDTPPAIAHKKMAAGQIKSLNDKYASRSQGVDSKAYEIGLIAGGIFALLFAIFLVYKFINPH